MLYSVCYTCLIRTRVLFLQWLQGSKNRAAPDTHQDQNCIRRLKERALNKFLATSLPQKTISAMPSPLLHTLSDVQPLRITSQARSPVSYRLTAWANLFYTKYCLTNKAGCVLDHSALVISSVQVRVTQHTTLIIDFKKIIFAYQILPRLLA